MSLIILITGTRKGIGKSLSEYFLSNGEIVIGCSRRESSIVHKNYLHHSIDVSSEKEVIQMVRSISKTHGRLDILINNAGIASLNHIVLTPAKTVESIFNTNFLGSFLMLREASKVMMKNKFGRIVNFTTVAVPLNLEGEAIYASSKAAIESLTKISAKELGGYGITVNAIGPAPINTDLIKTVPKDKIDRLLEHQAIKRFGSFEDVINVIDFYTSDKSDFITGQIIYLGGINK